jgi:hypothetical protein
MVTKAAGGLMTFPQENNESLTFPLTTVTLRLKMASNMDDIKQAAAILGKKGGQTITAKKARAARKNGKKGGRPRTKQ